MASVHNKRRSSAKDRCHVLLLVSKPLRIITSKYSVVVINFFTVWVVSFTIVDFFREYNNFSHSFNELSDVFVSVGVILVSYGVVLESRAYLMRIIGLYPKYQNDYEDNIDHMCHGHGVLLLVYGLLSEMAIEIVRMPDKIINATGIEFFVFSFAVLFFALSIVACIWNTVSLLRS